MFFRKVMFLSIAASFLCGPCPALAGQGNEIVELKIGTLAPKGVGWANLGEEILVPATSQTSDGMVRLRIYFGGILGDDKAVLHKMRQGLADGGGFSGQGAVLACRDFSVLELPFMFNDYDEVDYIRSNMLDRFEGLADKVGMKLVYWLDQDFDQLYSVNAPLAAIEDFPRAHFLTWYGILEEHMLRSLGADPISADVPESNGFIRDGKADAMVSTAIWIVGAQLHTKVRYFNPLKIRYSPAMVMLTRDAASRVRPEYWTRLYAIREDVVDRFVKATRADNQRCMDAMIKYGVKKVEMDAEEIQKVREKTMPVWDLMAGKLYSRELLDELEAHLSEFRKAPK